MWSAGVIIFIMLAGYAPFDDDNDVALYRKIRRGEHDMGDPVWEESISPLARDLVVRPHMLRLLHFQVPSTHLDFHYSYCTLFQPRGKMRVADMLQIKVAIILPLDGLARSKQGRINRGHGAQ